MKLARSLFLLIVSSNFVPLYCQTVTIGFMGDVMLGRQVNEIISRKGYKYPWGDFINALKKNDFNIINLESPLTKSDQKTPGKAFNFRASPDKVKTLQEGSITVANLANNHILDYGEKGMFETIDTLDKAGIYHVGAGKNLAAAQKPVIITKNDITIGIIGYTDNEPDWAAHKNKAGTNYFKVSKVAHVVKHIKKLKEKVDIVIVSLHWGPNMREKPSKEFVSAAHELIRAGADIIHGHSAHVLQPIERYKGKIIMYDAGDFIDDYEVDKKLRNDQTALFLVTVTKKRVKTVQLIPGVIKDTQVNKANPVQTHVILQKVEERSTKFNTLVDSRGVVTHRQKKRTNL